MQFKLTLKETVDQFGLMAKKSLGQNFLLNQNITDKIIRCSLEKQGLQDFSNSYVFEVGPGPGGLTRAIINREPKKLTVVEMDSRCVEIMELLKSESGVDMTIVNGDALNTVLEAPKGNKAQIVSNLPYHISVPLLLGWLKNIEKYEALTLMFQKEVADRILAPVKSKDYGRLSVLAQLICRIERLFDLNPECFVPAPKIWSSVLCFRPKDTLPEASVMQKVEKLTNMAFSQRRKMIRQSLKSVANLEEACSQAGVLLTSRAEEITPEQFYILAKNI